ncbi:MAG: TrmH family RNA methyltransferase [Halobacteriales archaeon]
MSDDTAPVDRSDEVPTEEEMSVPPTEYVDIASRRGYVGIGVYDSKFETNVGTLVRTAHAMGGTFVFTVGRRYEGDPSAVGQDRHIPVLNFASVEALRDAMPAAANLLAVELASGSRPLHTFVHPERAVYLLGAEDDGLPESVLRDLPVLEVPSEWCLNVATAGSLVLYDRLVKELDAEHHGPDVPDWWTR